jgi:DNA-binding XRE family transcriptional regulator
MASPTDHRAMALERHKRAAEADPATHPLRARRLAADMTARELAEAAGVSFQTIRNVEVYGKRPTLATLHRLAIVLACRMSDLERP